jgi:hypothetical protein
LTHESVEKKSENRKWKIEKRKEGWRFAPERKSAFGREETAPCA